MAKLSMSQSTKELPKAVIKQMLTLSTSGLGLVAALAWNEFGLSIPLPLRSHGNGTGGGSDASID